MKTSCLSQGYQNEHNGRAKKAWLYGRNSSNNTMEELRKLGCMGETVLTTQCIPLV